MKSDSDESIELKARLKTKRRLQATPVIESSGTAKLIYEAMVKAADRMSDVNKLLETKANGIIALSSAVLGFGASFANGRLILANRTLSAVPVVH